MHNTRRLFVVMALAAMGSLLPVRDASAVTVTINLFRPDGSAISSTATVLVVPVQDPSVTPPLFSSSAFVSGGNFTVAPAALNPYSDKTITVIVQAGGTTRVHGILGTSTGSITINVVVPATGELFERPVLGGAVGGSPVAHVESTECCNQCRGRLFRFKARCR